MSIPWNPSVPPREYDEAWIRQELDKLKQALEGASDHRIGRYLAAEPARVFAGMEVLADGTNWDPGSGEGKYRRNAANSAWVFLG